MLAARWLATLCLLVVATRPAAAVTVHPQDGPHADIRISIDQTGVRFGMMINLAFIDEMVSFPRESLDAVASVEAEVLRELLTGFFVEQNVVEIDGVEVTPLVREFEMIHPSLELLSMFPRSGMRGLLRARIDLEYPAKAMPRTVRFVWAAYPTDILVEVPEGELRPPMVVEAQLQAEGLFPLIRFTKSEPEVIWHGSGLSREQRFLEVPDVVAPAQPARLPALSLGLAVAGLVVMLAGVNRAPGSRPRSTSGQGEPGEARPGPARRSPAFPALALGAALFAAAPLLRHVGTLELSPEGAGLPTDAQARAIFEPLHANIYRAFDYEQRGEIYDALARSVTGGLLDSLYDQIYTSLIMHDQGGAVSRVSAVRLMRVDITSIALVDEGRRPGFTLEARWQVEGVVYHEGHSHKRTNEYVAEYSVARLDPGWRITGSRVISQERLDPDTGERPRPVIPDGEI